MPAANLESRVSRMTKRTKKEFKDYNDFRDRPFGLKWGTAYALDDLMKGVRINEAYALKNNEAKPQMSREEIDVVLSESFLQLKEVTLQLNIVDEFGRLIDEISGQFTGESYQDYFVLNEQTIFWDDVRHIELKQEKKWFDVTLFEDQKKLHSIQKKPPNTDLSLEKDPDSYQPFFEEGDQDE